jgi:hypothetical protein
LGLNFTISALKGQITTTQGNALSDNTRAINALQGQLKYISPLKEFGNAFSRATERDKLSIWVTCSFLDD